MSYLWAGVVAGLLCVGAFYVFDPDISVFSALITIAICGGLAWSIQNNKSNELYVANGEYFVAYTRDKKLHVFQRSDIDTVGYEDEGESTVLVIRSKEKSVRLDASISGRDGLLRELRGE